MLITGITTGVEAGQTVTISLNGEDYRTIVKSDGTFEFTVAANKVGELVDGIVEVSVKVKDVAGNEVSDTEDFTVDTNVGRISLDDISEDGYINATDSEEPLVITGTTSGIEPGQTVTVSLNGKDYLTTVKPDGSYEVTVPLEDVKALEDGKDYPVDSINFW